MSNKGQSELSVIIKAKELCKYVVKITENSPKKFRFTITSRLQNISMDIIEALYLANETFVFQTNNKSEYELRQSYQNRALTKIKLLAFFSQLALEQKSIILRQYEQIAKQTSECQLLLGGWIKSDKKRFRQ